MERFTIVFSGSGGQGVITAAVMLAETAVLYEGLNAVQTQTYGPEARGGAARADVIIANTEIRFPKVLQPRVLVCLSQRAYDKYVGTLRPGGLLITDPYYVKRDVRVDARHIAPPMYDAVKNQLGNTIAFNVCVLGALVQVTKIVRPESVAKVIEERAPSDFLELNRKAFSIGLDLARNLSE